MINIFFDPRYALRRKKYLKFPIKDSHFLNRFIQILFFLKVPISKNYVDNGALMLMNNILKNFKKSKNISINKYKFNNTYIVQFDHFGENTLEQILNNSHSKKILIGPLFTYEQLNKLASFVNEYPFIKILVSNIESFKSLLDNFSIDIELKNVIVMPCGVLPEKDVYFGKTETRNNKCLIYFKNNDTDKLNNIKEFLNSKNIEYIIFKNKFYKNYDLIKSAKSCKFSIVLSTTESQGFGIQELMSQNLPLLIWEETTNRYENKDIFGSSVPYWSDMCGKKFNNLNDLNEIFDEFYKNINKFNPAEFFKNELTFEKNNKNLFEIFNKSFN